MQDNVSCSYPDIVLIAPYGIEIALIDAIPEHIGLRFVDVTVCCSIPLPSWDGVKAEVFGPPHFGRNFPSYRLANDTAFESAEAVSSFLVMSGKRLVTALNKRLHTN